MGLVICACRVGMAGLYLRGASSEFQNKEVPHMEHLLLDIIAAVVAGVIVALIVKRFITR